jgi:energy-coupling factor transporter ATP-binding protein EcfA2
MSEIERAASALFHLDAGCPREKWVSTAMAAKAAGLPFDAFHNWSASGGNYAGEKDCRAVWDSIDADGPVTARTLYSEARAQGWRDSLAANADWMGQVLAPPEKTPTLPAIPANKPRPEEVWNRCEPATPFHGYIRRKNGNADGLRIYPHNALPLTINGQNVAGYLVVPCYEKGVLQTLQFISEQGGKLNLQGATFGNGCYTAGDIENSRQVFIVEGLGQAWSVWQATGDSAAVCMGAGRMRKITAEMRRKNPTARLVLVPDKGKEKEAQEIAAAYDCAWCELPPDKPDNYDVNDFMQEHGGEALAEILNCTRTPPMRFNLLAAAELCNAPPMCWMVKGVLPEQGLAALYGPSGSGKSFLVISLAADIAAGENTWFGRRIAPHPVTYCALEGEGGIGKRIQAWSQHYDKPVPDALRFLMQPFSLLDDSDVSDLATAVQRAGGAGGLVILDTLNRAASGADENSSADMGRIIAATKRLQDMLGGLVLLVHHTGKDTSKGLRGHSSLFAALDGAIEVTKAASGMQWTIAKSKDEMTGTLHRFRLEIVTVGLDDEHDEITSLDGP